MDEPLSSAFLWHSVHYALQNDSNLECIFFPVLPHHITQMDLSTVTTDIVSPSTIQLGNISACVRQNNILMKLSKEHYRFTFCIIDCNSKFFKLLLASAKKLECTLPPVLRQEIPTGITASVSALIWYGQTSV